MTPGGVAAGDLERLAVVVQSRPGRASTCRRAAAARWRLSQCGRPEFLLGEPGQVRREDDAAGVAGPVLDVEPGVVLGQVRVAGVAEDRLDEVEVADQAARGEEADLHRSSRRRRRAPPGRRSAAAAARRTSGSGSGRLAVNGTTSDVGRRADGVPEQRGEDRRGHGLLVAGDGQPAFGDVERALGGAAVAARVVQDAVADAVRPQDRVAVAVLPLRDRERAGDPVPGQDELLGCETERLGQAEVAEVLAQERLDPPVRRALARKRRQECEPAPPGRRPVGRPRADPVVMIGASPDDPELRFRIHLDILDVL